MLEQKVQCRCVLALTATATKATEADVTKVLRISPQNVVRDSNVRDNLRLSITHCNGGTGIACSPPCRRPACQCQAEVLRLKSGSMSQALPLSSWLGVYRLGLLALMSLKPGLQSGLRGLLHRPTMAAFMHAYMPSDSGRHCAGTVDSVHLPLIGVCESVQGQLVGQPRGPF